MRRCVCVFVCMCVCARMCVYILYTKYEERNDMGKIVI